MSEPLAAWGGRTHNRHSRDGGNPRRGAGDGFPSARERRAAGAPTIVIPATAEKSAVGGRRWVPVCTGTTGGGGRTHNRHSRDGGKIRGGGPAMGSRLHGNDGRRRAHPQSSFPRRRESAVGGRRWVPVCTGTTGGGGRTHNRHSRDGGNPRRGAGDGFPSARERRAAAGAPTIVIPATGGNPRRGAGDGFPSARERRAAAGAPTIVIPATAEKSTAGGRRWVPVCTGTTGGGGRTHNRHSRDGGNPRRGPAMGSRLHGNDGRRRAHPQSSFPRRRESTVGGRRWVPVCTGTTGGGGRTHNRHSRDGGNPRQGAGDGFPSARERRWAAAHPQSSFPRRRESTVGGRRWGSRLHGNDGRRRAHPQSSFPRRRKNPRRGAGDGFPSARERRAAAGAPTTVTPAMARKSAVGAGDGFPSARERRAATGGATPSFQ